MNKRGSHVEVIISFIIFVAFILFLFSILAPSIRMQKDKENIVDNIEFELINNVSSYMTIITVKFTGAGIACVGLSDLNIGNNIVVRNGSDEKVISSSDGNSLQINRVNPSETFFKIYYSEEFDELTGAGCSPITYELGLTKTDKYIFEKNVFNLIEQYSKYELLKDNLKIPSGVEFGYGIILSNGTTFETSMKNLSTNIYVTETPIKYVDSEGDILSGFLKTRIW